MIAGANYLHIGSQLPQLPDLIRDPIPAAHNRATMKISILGCKGGAGASTVAHQLFKAAGMLTSIPMLLVQGCSGSRDLDLLLAKALPSDGSITDLTPHQS
ncbi:pilus assembly protein CpaE, partial [Candidatus Symbiopectobacterium sp. NZEC135]|nr:pilus assembly protein CpaE [Candidatus Symbiopectobacterium sp. NZEC135]